MALDQEKQSVLSHYHYALQAAMETDISGLEKENQDLQTLVGLYLQDALRELAAMEESEVQQELSFYSVRPVHKAQGLLL
jgi:hypothetical protein